MEFSGFDWDQGNSEKCIEHGLTIEIIEQLFNRPITVFSDVSHSAFEKRLRAIGRSDGGRYIFVVFTLRHRGADVLIRPISARYMHAKEVRSYEKQNPGI